MDDQEAEGSYLTKLIIIPSPVYAPEIFFRPENLSEGEARDSHEEGTYNTTTRIYNNDSPSLSPEEPTEFIPYNHKLRKEKDPGILKIIKHRV